MGFDDDGVKTQKWPLIRDGVLGSHHQSRNGTPHGREGKPRLHVWQHPADYPCPARPTCMWNRDRPTHPTRQQLIEDVKDGVMIDGRGSYSIDQQRYNGQFGGHIFWEIKNGKITRQVTDVTYNAITTDFWNNLDGITGPKEWQMHGTGGDAKVSLRRRTAFRTARRGCASGRFR
ncbi:MAG: hypothetical protein IPP90_06050 [Gemmatimonadaceae bacterium]|nr:hypothetical protein [Gemmatimonadaceae bacterium]